MASVPLRHRTDYRRGVHWLQQYIVLHEKIYSSISYADMYHGSDCSKIACETIKLAIQEWKANKKAGIVRQWRNQPGRKQAAILNYVFEPARRLLQAKDEARQNISSRVKYDA